MISNNTINMKIRNWIKIINNLLLMISNNTINMKIRNWIKIINNTDF